MKNIAEKREIYDLIERNYTKWEIDSQFDRQPLCIVTKQERVDLLACAIWYGRQTDQPCVFTGTDKYEILWLWSEGLGPIIMYCEREGR